MFMERPYFPKESMRVTWSIGLISYACTYLSMYLHFGDERSYLAERHAEDVRVLLPVHVQVVG